MGFDIFPDYQCLERGTKGEAAKPNRSIPDRVDDYNLMEYLNINSKVLDLGCNRGYFGIYLSQNIHSYVGIDSDEKQIALGRDMIKLRSIDNCTLHNEDFKGIDQKFDIILCLAFHSYVSMSMEKFGKCLLGMLNPNGYIFLEGHPPGYREEPEKYFNPLNAYLSEHLGLVYKKVISDRKLKRLFKLFFNGKVGMVSCVYIVNKTHVEKRYLRHWRKEEVKHHWNKEVKALKLLIGEQHFPQILNIDEEKKIIKMSYCGERLTKENLPENWGEQCDEITKSLISKNIHHGDMKLKNICVKDDTIYLIDFGLWSETSERQKNNIKNVIGILVDIENENKNIV